MLESSFEGNLSAVAPANTGTQEHRNAGLTRARVEESTMALCSGTRFGSYEVADEIEPSIRLVCGVNC